MSTKNQDERKTFLIEMYRQLSNEMDRHIKVIWQIVGVLLGTFTVYALVEKKAIGLDIATSILVVVCALSIAIIIESNYWYNRNLVIVANIERQFLEKSDLKNIHYYFGKHRKNNAYLDMMIIQIIFSVFVLIIVMLYHLLTEVTPYFHLPISNFIPLKALPYCLLIISIILLWRFHVKREKNYNNFVLQSPGKTIRQSVVSDSDHKT